jgi:hypothetical protein
MIPFEFGFVFLYVAAFGFSDFFVKYMKLTGMSYLLYYLLIGCIGMYLLYASNFFDK